MEIARPNGSEKAGAVVDGRQAPNLAEVLREQHLAASELRRGICLLNAGQYAQAAESFDAAMRRGSSDTSLPAFLAITLIRDRKATSAGEVLRAHVPSQDEGAERKIQHALLLRASGCQEEGIRVLREAISRAPEDADLHFHLGNLLCDAERHDEAELRFTQACSINANHFHSWLNLGLCCAVRGAPGAAVKHLQRAQSLRPDDARAGLLLAHAAKAAHEQGQSVRIHAGVPNEDDENRAARDLAAILESEPDFADAFLCLPVSEGSEEAYSTLLRTLRIALERQPEQAELHFHCGRVLTRLGQNKEAIAETELAVRINPRFTKALIELGCLYKQTDRTADAVLRLEQAIDAGAEYADVLCQLGDLYRDLGEVARARQAYGRALHVNSDYNAAREALAAL